MQIKVIKIQEPHFKLSNRTKITFSCGNWSLYLNLLMKIECLG